MALTLVQAANAAGVPYEMLKKHAQRGKVRIVTIGGKSMVEEEDLEAYQALEEVIEVARKAQGQPAAVVARDLGNIIARLPQTLRDAILNGMPQAGAKGKTGGAELWHKGLAALGLNDGDAVGDPFPDDPHHGFPIGHRHDVAPRWARANTSTWILGDASYAWNGFVWEPGGTAKPIEGDVSPASPYADRRPWASGSDAVPRKAK